jgi:hypothetical protein
MARGRAEDSERRSRHPLLGAVILLGLSEWFSGPISGGGLVAQSDDGDAETDGKPRRDSVTGTVMLPGGKTGGYEASPPSGGAGRYEMTVSSGGELSGASAAGLAVKGEITLGKRGTGMVRLVDGKRLRLVLTRTRAGDLAPLRAGQVRLIVVPGGELRGVANPYGDRAGCARSSRWRPRSAASRTARCSPDGRRVRLAICRGRSTRSRITPGAARTRDDERVGAWRRPHGTRSSAGQSAH